MRAPDLDGPYGKAWQIAPTTRRTLDHEAHVDGWLVERPGAHMLWRHWMVACISLRDIPGVPPAVKRYPEAEFELSIVTADPGTPAKPAVLTIEEAEANGLALLQPPDVVFQFHGVPELEARTICKLVVDTIVNKGVSPDSDFRQWWMDTLRATVEHYKAGKHPTN